MTVLSPAQIIGLILKYHPSVGDDQIFNALAIALAESGGNLNATSPSHDYGLWQINRIHFGDGIITATNWTSQSVQLAEMWKLSGGMHNWAAWCTAWSNPGLNCGHGNLPNIQNNSAAWFHRDVASLAISRYRGTPPPGEAPPALSPEQQDEKAVSAAFAYMRNYYGKVAGQQYKRITAAAAKIERTR